MLLQARVPPPLPFIYLSLHDDRILQFSFAACSHFLTCFSRGKIKLRERESGGH